jgi:hypothetical protein
MLSEALAQIKKKMQKCKKKLKKSGNPEAILAC